jgi:hypothetical protein
MVLETLGNSNALKKCTFTLIWNKDHLSRILLGLHKVHPIQLSLNSNWHSSFSADMCPSLEDQSKLRKGPDMIPALVKALGLDVVFNSSSLLF